MLIFDLKTVYLVAGLAALMVCNIILGTALGALAGAFDWRKMLVGIFKAVVIAAALALIYAVGYFNADVITVEMGGQTVNLMAAVYLMALAAACTYAVQIFAKLKTMLAPPDNETVLAESDTIDLDKIIKDSVADALAAAPAENTDREGAGDNETVN
jgi:hypothetical protein